MEKFIKLIIMITAIIFFMIGFFLIGLLVALAWMGVL